MPSKMPASDAEPTTATRTVTGGLSGGSAGRTLDTLETFSGVEGAGAAGGGADGSTAERLGVWAVGRQASVSRAASPSARGAAVRAQPSQDIMGPPHKNLTGTLGGSAASLRPIC